MGATASSKLKSCCCRGNGGYCGQEPEHVDDKTQIDTAANVNSAAVVSAAQAAQNQEIIAQHIRSASKLSPLSPAEENPQLTDRLRALDGLVGTARRLKLKVTSRG